MNPVQITPQASQDIAKLAQGLDRTAVALAALEESELTPEQVQQLVALLKRTSPNESAPSSTQSQAVSEIKTIDNHQAVVGQISVKVQLLDTVLSERSFNKSRSDQHEYAAKLGCRMATREENRAYIESLLSRESNSTINDAEKKALNTYRERYVRDTAGGLDVDGRRIRVNPFFWYVNGHPRFGALFVRASAESK
jgi:hypothetical protein